LAGWITYGALSGACEKDQQPQRALQLFQAMQEEGSEPNFISYNALMQSMATAGQTVAAAALLRQAEARG